MNLEAAWQERITTLNCPRCIIELQEVKANHDGVTPTGNLCSGCDGIWLANDTLDALAHLKLEGLKDSTFEATLVADHPDVDLTPRINCPVCNSVLDRFVFCVDSGVTIDRCAEHGMWLDDGELSQVVSYLQQEVGLPSVAPVGRQLGFLAGLRRLLLRS